MSEQSILDPLYVVLRSYDLYRVAMRTDTGIYLTVCEMQGPFNSPAAALRLVEMLTAVNEPLPAKQAGDKDK